MTVYPHPLGRWQRLTPAAAGIAGIVGATVFADVWASHTQRPTISAFVGELLEHPVAAPLVIGGLGAAGWHLAIDPIIRRLTP